MRLRHNIHRLCWGAGPHPRSSSAQRSLRRAACLGAALFLSLAGLFGAASATQRSSTSPEAEAASELHQALAAARQGNGSRALSLTDRLLQQHPDFVPALKLKGALLEASGHAAEAQQFYERGLKLTPDDPDLLFKVGVHKLTSGSREEAIALFKRYVHFQPTDGEALYYLAQAYHLTGQDALGLKAIEECIKYKPDEPAVWQKYGELLCSSGDNERGFEWLLKARQANPGLERIDFDLGVASLNRMDLQSAATYAENAAKIRPNDLEAQTLYASIEAKLSRWQDARAAYERVLALKDDVPDALLELGHCELELKQYQQSIETLNHLLDIDPAMVMAHFYLSRDYAGLGNASEAKHQAALHHRMMEQSSFAASALGTEEDKAVWDQAKQLLAEHKEDAAIELFRKNAKGPAASPGHPYFLVGTIYLYAGNPADGIRALRHALQLDPRTRGAHTYLGILDLQLGKVVDAEHEFQTELANDPNYEIAIAELGVVRARQQRWDEAAEQLARSHTRSPALLLTLCDAYFHLGRVQDATLTAEITAAYAHGDKPLMDALALLLNRNHQEELAQRLAHVPAS